MLEPLALKIVKQEIKNAAASGPTSPALSKITIHTSDAIWMVSQVELLLKIAEAFKIKNNRKGKIYDDTYRL